MPKYSIAFGFALILLGLIAYFGSDLKSDKTTDGAAATANQDGDNDGNGKKKSSAITGLAIPASFGVLLVVCGVVGLKESARKHAMHGAAMVGTLGALGTIGKGGYDLYKLATGLEVNGRAMTFVWLMALICFVFVGLCVKSFIEARKKREAEEALSAQENS